jgi:hypothetical protein
MADWRESAVSVGRWRVVEPYLEGLTPGDDFGLFIGARQVHERGGRKRRPPVVVIPSWISSLSGGATGGLSMFGQLVGRSGDTVTGSHVFGTVEDGRIVPRHQVFTRAVVVSQDEFEGLGAIGTRGIGAIPRPAETLFFRDLYVVGGRPLTFPEASASAPSSDLDSRGAYEIARPVLEALPEGTDLLGLLAALDASYLTSDFGESHSLQVRGFLHGGLTTTRSIESPDGIFKLRPFGWREDGVEHVDRIAVFENDRLVGVVPHRGLTDWTVYLREALVAAPRL